jgi:hypothetical protein
MRDKPLYEKTLGELFSFFEGDDLKRMKRGLRLTDEKSETYTQSDIIKKEDLKEWAIAIVKHYDILIDQAMELPHGHHLTSLYRKMIRFLKEKFEIKEVDLQ